MSRIAVFNFKCHMSSASNAHSVRSCLTDPTGPSHGGGGAGGGEAGGLLQGEAWPLARDHGEGQGLEGVSN